MLGSQKDRIAKTKLESLFGKNFNTDMVNIMQASAMVKKEDGLGLEIKHMVVVTVGFQSQFMGELIPGDILIGINGQSVLELPKFVKNLHAALGQSAPATKVTLKFIRLKKRANRPVRFPPLQKTDGYTYETAVIYNYRGFFPFGLEVREVGGRFLICHTAENTIADMFLSTGAYITDVDGENITSCVHLNERIKKSFEIRNYALVSLEIPNNDGLKNAVRKKIAEATKETIRTYPIPNDAKVYALEGIAAVKTEIEPESIWVGDGNTKSPSLRSEIPYMDIVKNVVETDVPTSWNSYLFVKIPPQKSVDSENTTGASPS